MSTRRTRVVLATAQSPASSRYRPTACGKFSRSSRRRRSRAAPARAARCWLAARRFQPLEGALPTALSGGRLCTRAANRARAVRGALASSWATSCARPASRRRSATPRARPSSAIGGTWDDDLTSFTTILVCAKVFGKKAEHARKRLGRVRLVTPSWLAWSLQTVRLATPQQHKVPIFLGVVVTCSGLPHEIRARIGQALEAHGGELAAGFYARRTTHFVCGDISSPHSLDNVDVRKLVEACRLGIPVVRPRWIADCVESKPPARLQTPPVHVRGRSSPTPCP